MKKYIIPLWLGMLSFLTTACFDNENQTIKVEIKDKSNALLEIKNTIASLEDSRQSTTLLLPKDQYHFRWNQAQQKELYISNHDQDNPKNVAFLLENLENITIDGNGSQFVFHGTMIPFVLKNCKNVTLKNFSIDFELPHIRQIEIQEVDTTHNITIAKIHPQGNYQIQDNKLVILGEDYKRTPYVAMAFNPNKRLSYQRSDVNFTPEKISEISPNILKIENWEQNQQTQVGERFALRTYNRPTPAIFIDFCKNTSVENVTIHYADGMGLLAQMSENITLNKFQVKLNENDQRYFTTQADATHFSGCKGVIISENGFYESMADDAINVHGTYLKVTERISPNSIKARYMHPQTWGFLWAETGDSIQFVLSKTMDLLDNQIYTIKNIKAIDQSSEFGAKIFEIEFTRDIPQKVSEKNSIGIENLSWTPKVIFRNNTIRNNRARGALFSTPKEVICENNLFDHTHGTAILLCGDCNGWYETGACRNISIRNNRFVNSLTANYQFTNAIISIYPEIPNLEGQKHFFHSGISIENNVFETFDAPVLYAKSVQNLSFANNQIIKNTDFAPFHWNTYPFFFEKTENIILKNNTIDNLPIEEKNLKIHLSDKKSIQILNK